MSTSLEQLIQFNRERTREQVLRALLRANARQSDVARRRVAWRGARRKAFWLLAAALTCAAVVAGLQWWGVVPHMELVVGGVRAPVAAPVPPTPSVPEKVVPAPPYSAETDQPSADPVELKLTTEIGSKPF